MTIEKILEDFRQFLIASWTSLPNTMKANSNSELDDWFQTNWEILVESRLFYEINNKEIIRLNCFGNGADCNGASSRVFDPDTIPTHFIKVNGRYKFESFGKQYDNGWFEIEFPFDAVQVIEKNGNELTLKAGDLKFELEKINTQNT